LDKERWKDDVLDSVKGIKPVEPNPFLFTRIKQRLQEGQSPALIPKSKIRLAAIGLVLLCALNVWAVVSSSERQDTRQSDAGMLDISPYQLY
jgi:hypothetical protein